MTHIQMQHKKFNELTWQVCNLLGWDETEYAAYMEKCGKQYLQHYIPQDPAGIDMLIESKLFWAWWRSNWYTRDAKFAACMLGGGKDVMVEIYREYHDPRTLAKCIYPNGVVLDYTYKIMIQELIDKKGEGV